MTAPAPSFLARPELQGSFGMVASTHWLASAVGMAMLERGGNAFDAAVAAGFTLQIAEPHLNGPGGDLPIILHTAAGATRVICAQGPAPAAADIPRFRDLGLDLVPGTGFLPATVPGVFDGWMTLLRDFGTMSLEDVLTPAIGYAEQGCPLVPRIIQTIGSVKEMFLEEWRSSAEIWLPGGEPPTEGKLFRNPVLAATYRRVLAEAKAKSGREAQIEEARRLWYRGWVAEAIGNFTASFAAMDTSGRRHRGLLTAQDMAEWQAGIEAPASYDYGRYTVFKCGPWSQGPVFLQQLALCKQFDLAAMDPLGPDFVHTVVECAKLAFADRDGFYGDPDFVEVPLQALLSDEYNAERARLVGTMASTELQPGTIDGKLGWADLAAAHRGTGAAFAKVSGVGEPTVRRDGATGGDTCHIDVVDRWGNMVACTPSGGWLQSSPAIPGLGFCLGTRGQMYWLDPSSPSALGPKRRPRSTLTPSFATRDGKPYMAFGTPGGDQQDQWSLTFFLRHVHHGLSLQQSIEAPAWTSEHWPNSFWPRAAKPAKLALEGRFPRATIDELARRGHDVEVGGDWSLGRLSAVSSDEGILKAGANPRGAQGYAAGR
jgi:gamma-glutamyltranspeptidase/glutathione hydrolase